MNYDLIYPADENQAHRAPCVIAAAYFEPEELIALGVNQDSEEVNQPFSNDNEFEKVFKLWDSPLYLRKFFKEHIEYFKQEYWNGITEEKFVEDVIISLNRIKKELLDLITHHRLGSIVKPLSPEDEVLRLSDSIKVKIKQGFIHGRYAFRFYAIEIEENKCYLITGAAIKIHKDMLKAPNTKIEMAKLIYALKELSAENINTKDTFLG